MSEALARVDEAELLRAELEAREKEEAELLRDHLAIRCLADFVQRCWPELEPATPLQWGWHLQVISDALQRQIEGDPEYRRLLICVPPGSAKSLLVSVFAPAWEWLTNPGRRKLFLSNDDDLVRRDSRRTRDLLYSPTYQRLHALAIREYDAHPWAFAHDQNEKHNFENGARGGRACYSIDARITGKRADDVVIDDPVDAKEVVLGTPDQVEARLNTIREVISKVLPSRVNNRRTARWTLIMQRLHPADPAGWALEKGWRPLVLPLEFDSDHPQRCAEDPRSEPGEILHPGLFPAEVVEGLRSELGGEFEIQYNQRPVRRAGGTFRREWFGRSYSEPPRILLRSCDEVWATVDAAKKRTATADYYSVQIWGRRGQQQFLLAAIRRRLDYPEFEALLDRVILALRGLLTGVLIEDTAHGTTYLQCWRAPTEGREAPRVCATLPLVPFLPGETPGKDKSKEARALYAARAAESGQVCLPDADALSTPLLPPDLVDPGWLECWLSEICAFPGGARKDQVDSWSQLALRWTLQSAQPSHARAANALENLLTSLNDLNDW